MKKRDLGFHRQNTVSKGQRKALSCLKLRAYLSKNSKEPKPGETKIHFTTQNRLLRKWKERMSNTEEFNHGLIDYLDNNKILKKIPMSYSSAYERNAVLKGLGLSWARID